MSTHVSVLLLFALLALATDRAAASPSLGRADAHWDRRAEGHVDAQARPEPIAAAIASYRSALDENPDRVEAHWKLQRALWFAGDFATPDPVAERARYQEAIAAAEDAFDALARRVGGRAVLDASEPDALRDQLAPADRSDAAHLYFWYAINLGAWARGAGLLDAVRAGAAGRLHDATLRSIALDPGVEQGGAIRLLSRLHAELPRVPIVSGWVDPALAIPLAERAAADYPRHPGNPFLLGLTLLERVPARRDEALALLERTAALAPRADHVIEDISIRLEAREQLAAGARSGPPI